MAYESEHFFYVYLPYTLLVSGISSSDSAAAWFPKKLSLRWNFSAVSWSADVVSVVWVREKQGEAERDEWCVTNSGCAREEAQLVLQSTAGLRTDRTNTRLWKNPLERGVKREFIYQLSASLL